MSILNYQGKKSGTYQGASEKPPPVPLQQYILHYTYGINEPTIMRLSTNTLQKCKTATGERKKKSWKTATHFGEHL